MIPTTYVRSERFGGGGREGVCACVSVLCIQGQLNYIDSFTFMGNWK